jgi:signal transduction histidine kinase
MFWRIYATLLASLLVVIALTGLMWRFLGPRPFEDWAQITELVSAAVIPPSDAPGPELHDALARLAKAADADVSLFTADGAFRAAVGEPIPLPRRRPPSPHPPPDADTPASPPPRASAWTRERRGLEFSLPDGRILLLRPRRPALRAVWHLVLMLLAVSVTIGIVAIPIVARLTARLERLRAGVERWGDGNLKARVDEAGADEIAALARSFNQAATRVADLLAAHKDFLANASHELRSPLARLRLAIELWHETPTPARLDEILRDLRELDTLIDEILLASRLDHLTTLERREPVDLLALAAEEAARAEASVDGEPVETDGDPRLLRRMLRNLLENAVRHGAPPVEVTVGRSASGSPEVVVADRGPGIAEAERRRIFSPFYRPAYRDEAAGGWGLGLSLVRQIAEQHGGVVSCEARDGGGTRFVVRLA